MTCVNVPSPIPRAVAVSVALAGSALLVAWLESRFLQGTMTLQLYILLLCGLCTALGAWFGLRISRQRHPSVSFSVNTAAMTSLGISTREAEVLSLLALGHSNQEIAERLYVSANTVKTHLRHLYDKLEVSRRGQAVERARRLGLVP